MIFVLLFLQPKAYREADNKIRVEQFFFGSFRNKLTFEVNTLPKKLHVMSETGCSNKGLKRKIDCLVRFAAKFERLKPSSIVCREKFQQ